MEGTQKKPAQLQEFIDKGLWGKQTWSDVWKRNAELYPDREAVVDCKARLTWAQANMLIDRIAFGLLELGYKKDDILVSQYPNWFETALIRVACERIGVINAPILRNWRESEVEYTLGFTGAKGFAIPHTWETEEYYAMAKKIRDAGKAPNLEHIFISRGDAPADTVSMDKILETPYEKTNSPDALAAKTMPCTEVAFLVHTTGSTGFPKFAEWPAVIMIERAKETVAKLEFTKDSVVAAFTPAIGGINNPTYQSGALAAAKIVLLEKWNPEEALKLIEKERITYFGIVPTMARTLCDMPDLLAKYDRSSVQSVMITGGPASPSLLKEAEEKIGGKVVFVYGSRELGGIGMPYLKDSKDVRLLSTGKPNKWDEIMIVDDDNKPVPSGGVGEVMVRSKAGFVGYFRNPEATKQAFSGGGVVDTGDLGRLDEEGNLFIMGRKKKIIIRGGENIFPAELENVLSLHPRVNTIAVVKMPDKLMGERACAYVKPEKGQVFTIEDMRKFLDEKGIAKYKWPERLEIVDQIPQVGDGKIDMTTLEADIVKKLKAEGVEFE